MQAVTALRPGLARPRAAAARPSLSSSSPKPMAVAPRAARAPVLLPLGRRTPIVRSTASAGGAAVPDPAPTAQKTGLLAGLKDLATPFSDPVANSRLVALCVAQMLCSVATLIHDT